MSFEPKGAIHIEGACQNNLCNLTLDLPLNSLTVVTGVSGSGKSSLVFDTVYAEGQRRYVETFSPYARQFLERMDKPHVKRIEGIPPAIAIDQVNSVRTSRSTVGTMTELTEHFKLLYARSAKLYCRCCGELVQRDTVTDICRDLAVKIEKLGENPRLLICFPVTVPKNFTEKEVIALLERQGYTRIHQRIKGKEGDVLEVVQDRFRFSAVDQARLTESIESALHHGKGHLSIFVLHTDKEEISWPYSTALHCARCDIHYSDPTPGLFSFNSPIGACETCRGFGRVIDVDFSLVIPDESKTLAEGAVKPWQTKSYEVCQRDLDKMAKKYGVAMNVPFRDLPPEHRYWLLEGDDTWKSWESSWPKKWYGVRRFFQWLETKAYKMHIRVLLSRYRRYSECPACFGARLKPEALLWRLPVALPGEGKGRGIAIHEVFALPIESIEPLISELLTTEVGNEAAKVVLDEIQVRLKYLNHVGLSYLTLDRQSRTLSGGEVQRINLTTALGTSLVNTLFVFDEPSIGLHPRDINRILDAMIELRDAGNTLIVVEHDPQIMIAADDLLEIGPGPGKQGGKLVAHGTPIEIIANPDSLTGRWLSGKEKIDINRPQVFIDEKTPHLVLEGVRQHNLKNITVEFPLKCFVCLTGVSGSGKSTLIENILYPVLARYFSEAAEQPGSFDKLYGAEHLSGVVLIDQSAIGKSSRSNPVSYIGAWDVIRTLFAALPESKERGYTAGTFSFNSGKGRCPNCKGSGFEHVEMQFLSDVWLRCPDCDGKRYRAEILELIWRGCSVADVLEMTVTEALTFFSDQPKICAALFPLAEVGLGYICLGQPVPTLSGGEAQRLKLAAHLGDAAKKYRLKRTTENKNKGLLFLFDEPTTGLHFEDVSVLLKAFSALLEQGHSLVVIEHNLDVIKAADWIIDLGPEGGNKGGEVVVTGTPEEVGQCTRSYTGKALDEYARVFARSDKINLGIIKGVQDKKGHYQPEPAIHICHAREHNLKNISLDIPRNAFTVVTGLSGSGKSTLAFDIIFSEGQRRYLESLNAYSRQFVQPATRPDVDHLSGIPPTVAIEQRTSRGGRKSTVATLSEIYPFLRLFYVKLGIQYCPCCNLPVTPQSPEAIFGQIMRDFKEELVILLAPLVSSRKGLYTALARWARGKGYAYLNVDGENLPTTKWPRLDRYKEHTIALPVAELAVTANNEGLLREKIAETLEYGKGVLKVLKNSEEEKTAIFSTLRACPGCNMSFPELDSRLFSYSSKQGWCPVCYGTGLKTVAKVEDPDLLDLGETIDTVDSEVVCPVCQGTRLNPIAQAVRFQGRSLPQIVSGAVSEIDGYFKTVKLSEREKSIAQDLVSEISDRLSFLQRVGLGYLALNRSAPTLSGGEAQRIRLAAQLGSNLRGVCYVLDEPTIGLHPRDNALLLDTLISLRDQGNTLLVVEHDEETMRRADHVIDLGPGAGVRGGEIVAQGKLADLISTPLSVTGACLREPLKHPVNGFYRSVDLQTPAIKVTDAYLNNLKNISVSVPLGRFTVVTGVSGSGKSSLVHDVIHANMVERLSESGKNHSDDEVEGICRLQIGCRGFEGWEQIGRVLEVDQTPIGKTSRSCPATYIGFWDVIRKYFAETFEARTRGWNASRFSFNTGAGRCELCAGLGLTTVEMNFLPDVKTVCELCGGARFNSETLTVRWRGKTIAEVLAMPVDEAIEFFESYPRVCHPLKLLQDVGLGYLTLGQSSSTLSGGEAQRIKLVTELSKVKDTVKKNGRTVSSVSGKHTLYILDEPTVGLHVADVEKLVYVLHRLVDAGHTVLIVEHDLVIIAEADWLIDLGPEGGDKGGECVVQGTVKTVQNNLFSYTGQYLKAFMVTRSKMDLKITN